MADEPRLTYYLAALDSESSGLVLAGRPAERESFDTGEDVYSIVRSAEPILDVPASLVRDARVYPVADFTSSPPGTRAVVRLGFGESGAVRLDRLMALHPELYLLVRLNGRLVDLEPIVSTATRGYPGGTFASLDEAQEVYASAGIPLRVVVPRPEEVAERERFEREYRAAARWIAACDPESYAGLRSEGIDRWLGTAAADAPPDPVDCDAPAPAFPPAPPGMPDVCVVAREDGAHENGERVGAWTVFNPYGQQLRIDSYRGGAVDRSVWLRDCPGSGSD